MIRPVIIAIDGYSSTGKSTFAKLIAKELGYVHIDTGAMYRAVTLLALRRGCIHEGHKIDGIALRKILFEEDNKITFRISRENGASETYLNDENVERHIRSLAVSSEVSYIASIDFVRDYISMILKDIGRNKKVVMDGRDIGATVFPDAEIKIFMTARPEVRAQRRLKEMMEKGEEATFEDILKNLKERDFLDEHREISPLSKAPDALLLDNSDMNMEDQLRWFKEIIAGRLGR